MCSGRKKSILRSVNCHMKGKTGILPEWLRKQQTWTILYHICKNTSGDEGNLNGIFRIVSENWNRGRLVWDTRNVCAQTWFKFQNRTSTKSKTTTIPIPWDNVWSDSKMLYSSAFQGRSPLKPSKWLLPPYQFLLIRVNFPDVGSVKFILSYLIFSDLSPGRDGGWLPCGKFPPDMQQISATFFYSPLAGLVEHQGSC